jgi:hypothetical protein
MSNGVALYYPHTEFRTPEWLKWALLFWDNGIRRIIAPGKYPGDYGDLALAIEAGAIINTSPEPYLELAAAEFAGHLDAFKAIAAKSDASASAAPYPRASDYIDASWDLRIGKVHPDIVTRLLDEGLASITDGQDGRILRVAPALAALYMTILARKISDGSKMPVITDRPKYLRLANEILGGTVAEDVPESSDVVQNVLVDFIDPTKVGDASMGEILDIRKKLLPYMRAFREELEDVVEVLSQTTDAITYENGIKDAHARISDAVARYKAECTKSNLEFGVKALGITGLSLIPTVATILGYSLLPVTAGASVVASFALTALLYKQSRRVAANSNHFQYVLSLQSELT